ncbi:MAG: glycosyltransferase [Rhodobacterales bacterium]|nr:glycosyltransferase [Rhodobacterales bacterium]
MTLTVGAVAIGRNEGDRLKRCLTSLTAQGVRVVYVDSGSTDGSVAFAESLGVAVVQLDTSVPFTAARARNAGFAALEAGGLPDLVQFVDGDCGVAPGWIGAARAFMEATPEVRLVTGWRTELHPEASVFNAMAEVEWHRPAGEIAACGGDLMVRSDIFREVGGFNPRLICSEDEDFVIRVRRTGAKAWRLPEVMTLHDLAMTEFSAWWKRTVRTGHGFAEVGRMNPPHFRRELQRAWVYGAVFPVLAIVGIVSGWWWLAGLVVLGYGVNWLQTARGLMRDGMERAMALHQAFYLTLSKIANVQGMLTYHLRRWRGADMVLIEYK